MFSKKKNKNNNNNDNNINNNSNNNNNNNTNNNVGVTQRTPVGIYLFKGNSGNTRIICEICAKLTIKTERHQ